MEPIVASDATYTDLLKEHPNVIVKFYADWCGSCRLFAPKFKRLAKDESFSGVTFLDVNAEHNPEFRKLAGVTNLPFFATFQNGELKEADYTAKEETVKTMLANLA